MMKVEKAIFVVFRSVSEDERVCRSCEKDLICEKRRCVAALKTRQLGTFVGCTKSMAISFAHAGCACVEVSNYAIRTGREQTSWQISAPLEGCHSVSTCSAKPVPVQLQGPHTATVSPIWQIPTPSLVTSTGVPSPSMPPPRHRSSFSAASRHRLGGSLTSSYCPLKPPLTVP